MKGKGKKAKKIASKTKKVNPIPKGYHAITPSLVVRGAEKAIDFYKQAFEAKERNKMYSTDGKTIMHAEMQIGDSIFMLSDEFPNMGCRSPQSLGGTSTYMYVYVKNADAIFSKATFAGATVTMPVMDMFWGDRYGQLSDPFGHVWGFATRKKNLSEKEMRKAAEAAFKEMAEKGQSM